MKGQGGAQIQGRVQGQGQERGQGREGCRGISCIEALSTALLYPLQVIALLKAAGTLIPPLTPASSLGSGNGAGAFPAPKHLVLRYARRAGHGPAQGGWHAHPPAHPLLKPRFSRGICGIKAFPTALLTPRRSLPCSRQQARSSLRSPPPQAASAPLPPQARCSRHLSRYPRQPGAQLTWHRL